jgi:glucose-6-phosphate dehydrogenase assembly protein OpcA
MVFTMRRYKVGGMATDKSAKPGGKLPWAGKSVRPDQIEEELISLWHLAADNMRTSQNMNVRTSVLNFVICALSIESAQHASTLLRELSSTHIARVTLVILDMRSNLPSEVFTWITLRSFPIISDVMRHPFEQVTVALSGNAVYNAANTIQSLLKPDLPVYLWWVDDLPQDLSLFHRIISSSSRTIIDSSVFITPDERIKELSTLLQNAPDSALSDLNWARITPWCELIAQFFDVAEYRPYLVNADSIEIEHAVTGKTDQASTLISPNPIRALLLAAWLQTRLGWQRSADDPQGMHDAKTGTYSWHMTKRKTSSAITGPLIASQSGKLALATGGSIDITIRPRLQTELHPGNICLIRLSCKTNDIPAVFTINRGDDDDHVVTSVQISGSNRPQRAVNIAATHKENVMLSDELEIMGRDHLYEQTLHEVFLLLNQ